MKTTDFTRRALAYRRFARTAEMDGFERLSENGAPLWLFIRGGWTRYQITDVRIAPDGHQLWIKHNAPPIIPDKAGEARFRGTP